MMPEDPVMLLSFINTALRDDYDSLEDLCKSLDADKINICEKLSSIGYFYNEEKKAFV